jgi:hypothetical protein
MQQPPHEIAERMLCIFKDPRRRTEESPDADRQHDPILGQESAPLVNQRRTMLDQCGADPVLALKRSPAPPDDASRGKGRRLSQAVFDDLQYALCQAFLA